MKLNKTQQAVLDTYGLSEKRAMQYLKDHNIKISRAQYYNVKKKLKTHARDIIFDTARYFEEKHMERVETIRLIITESWENYHKLKDRAPAAAQRVLDSIAELQYIAADFDEASRDLIEKAKTPGLSLPKELKTPE